MPVTGQCAESQLGETTAGEQLEPLVSSAPGRWDLHAIM